MYRPSFQKLKVAIKSMRRLAEPFENEAFAPALLEALTGELLCVVGEGDAIVAHKPGLIYGVLGCVVRFWRASPHDGEWTKWPDQLTSGLRSRWPRPPQGGPSSGVA